VKDKGKRKYNTTDEVFETYIPGYAQRKSLERNHNYDWGDVGARLAKELLMNFQQQNQLSPKI
jgi:hypothetical protein